MSNKWTRDESIIALLLYTIIPFGNVDKNNPDIIAASKLIGRTPSAVAMKICNFAHLDPELQKRGISGLSNISKLDKIIWTEFSGKWDNLLPEYETILKKYQLSSDIEYLLDYPKDNMSGDDIIREVNSRKNQWFFRKAVLSAYNYSCCITGLAVPELLIASHIKPWKVSDPKIDRLNPKNGLCLNPLHDKAFDRGLITIDKNYTIIISSEIKHRYGSLEINDFFRAYEGKTIVLPTKFVPDLNYIDYHNQYVFRT